MRPAPGFRENLKDVIVVVTTPFSADGVLDVSAFRRNLHHFLEAGVAVVCVGGNTGEYYALGDDELVDQVDAAREVGQDAILLAGVGGRVADAAATAATLLDRGVDAVMVHHPPGPYLGARGLGRYFAEVAEAVDGPVVLYPRGPLFDERSLAELRGVSNIVAIKYGHTDVRAFGRLAASAPEIAWICGLAESWAPAFWPYGATGFTSGLANVAPRHALALQDALRGGDAARVRELWRELDPFEELRARNGDANNVTVIKAALDAVGLAGGPVRPPLVELSDPDRRAVHEIVERWGISIERESAPVA